MTKTWKATIDLWDIHETYQNGVIDINGCAVQLADRLDVYRDRNYNTDSVEFDELSEFSYWLRNDVDGDVDNYDGMLREIYDWADQDKRLWLNSFKTK
jgi:hypothetical protein